MAKTQKWDALDELMPAFREFASEGLFLQKNECQLKLAYIEGLSAFYHQDFITAINKCNWMLINYQMEFDWLKGFSYFLRGQSYEQNDDFGLAVADFKEVLKMDSYYPEVEEAKKWVEEIGDRRYKSVPK